MAVRCVLCVRAVLAGRRTVTSHFPVWSPTYYNSRLNSTLATSGRQLIRQTRFLGLHHTKLVWRDKGMRSYVTTTSGEGGDSGDDSEAGEGEQKIDEEGYESDTDSDSEGTMTLELVSPPKQHAIAPLTIPVNFPEIPVLPVSRNPLFPKFVKMLEVGDSCMCVCVYIIFIRSP